MDRPLGIAVSSDGATVFVTGTSLTSSDTRWTTIAYDATTGTTRWIGGFDGRGGGFAAPVSIGVGGSMVYVTGGSPGSDGQYRWTTIAYDDLTGAKRWIRFRRTGGPDALSVSSDGATVVEAGSTFDPESGSSDYTVVAYDAATGRRSWVAHYGAFVGAPVAVDLSSTAVFVTGGRDGTVAFDLSSGADMWARPGCEVTCMSLYWPNSIQADPNGSAVYIAGQSHSHTSTGYDFAVVAYDASTGKTLWVSHYDGASGFDFAEALDVSPDGSSVVVTGASEGTSGRREYATVAYDASTGAERWAARRTWVQDGDSDPRAIAIGSDSTVIVTGATSDGPSDYGTVAYAG
jgi:hypothetical protein